MNCRDPVGSGKNGVSVQKTPFASEKTPLQKCAFFDGIALSTLLQDQPLWVLNRAVAVSHPFKRISAQSLVKPLDEHGWTASHKILTRKLDKLCSPESQNILNLRKHLSRRVTWAYHNVLVRSRRICLLYAYKRKNGAKLEHVKLMTGKQATQKIKGILFWQKALLFCKNSFRFPLTRDNFRHLGRCYISFPSFHGPVAPASSNKTTSHMTQVIQHLGHVGHCMQTIGLNHP